MCVCVRALRIVANDNILRFKNTFILLITIIITVCVAAMKILYSSQSAPPATLPSPSCAARAPRGPRLLGRTNGSPARHLPSAQAMEMASSSWSMPTTTLFPDAPKTLKMQLKMQQGIPVTTPRIMLSMTGREWKLRRRRRWRRRRETKAA